jgi:hypothetical protein
MPRRTGNPKRFLLIRDKIERINVAFGSCADHQNPLEHRRVSIRMQTLKEKPPPEGEGQCVGQFPQLLLRVCRYAVDHAFQRFHNGLCSRDLAIDLHLLKGEEDPSGYRLHQVGDALQHFAASHKIGG